MITRNMIRCHGDSQVVRELAQRHRQYGGMGIVVCFLI